MTDTGQQDRTSRHPEFALAVKERFAFLVALGFSAVESSATLVRFQKSDLQVSIHHERNSFELGFDLYRKGTRYSLGELIRLTDAEAGDRYRDYAATTPDGTVAGLTLLAALVERHAGPALRGDPRVFEQLDQWRASWRERYGQEVLAAQLRPQAEAAFRQGNYREAAKLYERIGPTLTAVELKKLELARRRR